MLASLLAVQWIGLDSFLGFIAISAVSALIWKLQAIQTARHIWAIEYLCDDLGAHVHGVAVSISGLMKLGVEWEVLTALQQHAAVSAQRGQLGAQEVVESVMAAIPYGHTSREELQLAVDKSLRQRANQGPSLGGFLNYMWNSDTQAEVDEEFASQMKRLQALQRVPRIPWETLLLKPSEIDFNERGLEALVELIEQFPQAELFHTPEAVGVQDPMHPPLKQRVLYLWHNRAAIENS